MKKYLNKKIIGLAILPAMALTLLGFNQASAHGLFGLGQNATPEQIATSQNNMFSEQATLLGLSADVIKQGWAEGKSLREIANANGITDDQLKQKMQDQRNQQMKDRLAALVSQGVITQAQADQRASFMATQLNSNQMKLGGHRGFGGMGF